MDPLFLGELKAGAFVAPAAPLDLQDLGLPALPPKALQHVVEPHEAIGVEPAGAAQQLKRL
eukprot:11156912-Lingulodinium_polyedra.AAC.1